jgi:hypothetical protein
LHKKQSVIFFKDCATRTLRRQKLLQQTFFGYNDAQLQPQQPAEPKKMQYLPINQISHVAKLIGNSSTSTAASAAQVQDGASCNTANTTLPMFGAS